MHVSSTAIELSLTTNRFAFIYINLTEAKKQATVYVYMVMLKTYGFADCDKIFYTLYKLLSLSDLSEAI